MCDKKMRKWSDKELKEFFTSDQFKEYTTNFHKRMKEFDEQEKQKFMDNIDKWIKLINTPMNI